MAQSCVGVGTVDMYAVMDSSDAIDLGSNRRSVCIFGTLHPAFSLRTQFVRLLSRGVRQLAQHPKLLKEPRAELAHR